MVTFSESRLLPWSAETVWAYLIAFEQVPLWEDGVVEVRQVTPGEPVVGTRIAARRRYAGRVVDLSGEVVELEPGRSATMRLTGGPIADSRATYAVEPHGTVGSRVTYTGDITLRWPIRLLAPLVPSAGRRLTRANLARLERRIAAGIPPGSREAGTE